MHKIAVATEFCTAVPNTCASQWPHVLRRTSAAARLQGLWVLIPPGHGSLSVVSVVYCKVEVSATN